MLNLQNSIFENKKVKAFGAILLITITTIFFVKTFLNYYQQVQDSIVLISPLNLVFSLALFACYLILRALSWGSLIQFLGDKISNSNSLTVWFYSEATRYIPGNIWSFASRVYLTRLKKISDNVSLLVLPVEIVVVTSVTGLLSVYAIFKNLERLPVGTAFYIVLIVPIIISLLIILLNKIIRRILKEILRLDLVSSGILKAIFFQVLGWSFYSAGTIILVLSLNRIENLPLLFSATILSWLIGYLSFVTPMGLGVRESAFVVLVGLQIGPAASIVVAVLSRVILILAELLILIILTSNKKMKYKFSNPLKIE